MTWEGSSDIHTLVVLLMLVPPELNPVMPMGVGEVFEGIEADKNAVNNSFAGLMNI